MMDYQQYIIKLFPQDIFGIILLYSGKEIIIELQHYFPKLLKQILINGKDLTKLKQVKCSHCYQITNESIQHLPHLEEITCLDCINVVGGSIKHHMNMKKI